MFMGVSPTLVGALAAAEPIGAVKHSDMMLVPT
jgi:hypothetical protein